MGARLYEKNIKYAAVLFTIFVVLNFAITMFTSRLTYALDCNSNMSASPRVINQTDVFEPPLAYPIGLISIRAPFIFKFTDFSGYNLWTISSQRDIYTNFVKIKVEKGWKTIEIGGTPTKVEYVLITNNYYQDNFILINGSYLSYAGKYYWEGIDGGVDRFDIGNNGTRGIVVGLTMYEYTIRNNNPTIQNLQNVTFLDIAPSFSVIFINDNNILINSYTAKAFYAVPTLTLSFIDYITSNGGTINYIDQYVRPEDGHIVISGATGGYFNIIYQLVYIIDFTLDGNTTKQLFKTIMYVHGTFTLNGLVNSTFYLLDLTEYNDFILREIAITSPVEKVMTRVRNEYSVNVVIANATDINDILYSGSAILFVYNNWIGIIPSYKALMDIIQNSIIQGSIIQENYLMISLFNVTNEFYIVNENKYDTPLKFLLNKTYINQILQNNSLESRDGTGISFLPVAWASFENGEIIIKKPGIMIIFTTRAISPDGSTNALLVIPVFFGNETLFQQAPLLYKKIYNNGIPYLVKLDGSWAKYTDYGLVVTGWHIMGFIDDQNNIFGGEPGKMVPLLVAEYRSLSSLYSPFYYGVSFDLPDIMTNYYRTNLSNLIVDMSFRQGTYNSDINIKRLREYMFGADTIATVVLNLPNTWLRIQSQEMIPEDINATIGVDYMDIFIKNQFSYGNRMFFVYGTHEYKTTNASELPTMFYNIMFNNITGIPYYTVNIYNGTSNIIETVFVTNISEGEDVNPGLAYANGIALSFVEYSVAKQFDTIHQNPTDIAVPIISRGILYVSRQGYEINGILIVGSIKYMYIGKTISNYNKYSSGFLLSSVSDESLVKAILKKIIILAEAFDPSQCDINIEALGLCINLTDASNSVIIEPAVFDDLNKMFILDSYGKANKIVAYYFDPNSNNLIGKIICDGNCTEVQLQNSCKTLIIPYSDASISPQNRLAIVQIYTYTGTGGGGGSGGGGGGGGIIPPPPGNITLPGPNPISQPSITTPKGLITLAMFIAFYVYYNQRMTHGQALTVATALAGVLSIILLGPSYLAIIIILFGIGIALYYVLGK